MSNWKSPAELAVHTKNTSPPIAAEQGPPPLKLDVVAFVVSYAKLPTPEIAVPEAQVSFAGGGITFFVTVRVAAPSAAPSPPSWTRTWSPMFKPNTCAELWSPQESSFDVLQLAAQPTPLCSDITVS